MQSETEEVDSGAVNVFVSGLPKDMTEEQLRQLCESCGTVLNVKLMINVKNGASRGFGFVLYADADTADRAVSQLKSMELSGSKLHADISKHAPEYVMHRSSKLLVRNIPSEATEAAVTDYFRQFGEIVSVKLKRDAATRRNMATIRFGDSDQAAFAVSGCNGQKPFEPSLVPLVAKLCEAPKDRREHLKAVHGEAPKEPSHQAAAPPSPPMDFVQQAAMFNMPRPVFERAPMAIGNMVPPPPFGAMMASPAQQGAFPGQHMQMQLPAHMMPGMPPQFLPHPSAAQFAPMAFPFSAPSFGSHAPPPQAQMWAAPTQGGGGPFMAFNQMGMSGAQQPMVMLLPAFNHF